MQPGEDAHPIRPARFWYWVAGAAGVAAVVWLALGLVLGFLSVNRQVEGFQRVPVPGVAQVSFDEPGGYTLYYEGWGAAQQATVPGFDVSLKPVGGGEEVSVRDYGASVTYDFARHSGWALGSFRIEAPGRFVLQTQGYADEGQANVAVGPSIGGVIFRALIPAFAGSLILLLTGAVLAVVVAVRRGRARRLLPAPAAQPVAISGQASGPAGWLTDPGGRHELRYWDGQRWTEHVSDRGAQGVDPV